MKKLASVLAVASLCAALRRRTGGGRRGGRRGGRAASKAGGCPSRGSRGVPQYPRGDPAGGDDAAAASCSRPSPPTAAASKMPCARSLRQAVTADGNQVLPAGTELVGTVTDVERSGRVKGRARVAYRFNSLSHAGERYDIATAPLSHQAEATKGEDATKIAVGAGAGAVVGALLGGGDGAAKGAAIGGARRHRRRAGHARRRSAARARRQRDHAAHRAADGSRANKLNESVAWPTTNLFYSATWSPLAAAGHRMSALERLTSGRQVKLIRVALQILAAHLRESSRRARRRN